MSHLILDLNYHVNYNIIMQGSITKHCFKQNLKVFLGVDAVSFFSTKNKYRLDLNFNNCMDSQ